MLGEESTEKDRRLFEKSLRCLTSYNQKPNAWEQEKFPVLVEAMEYLQSCAQKNANELLHSSFDIFKAFPVFKF